MRKYIPSSATETLSHHRIQTTEYCLMELNAAQAVLPMVHRISNQAAIELEPVQVNQLKPVEGWINEDF